MRRNRLGILFLFCFFTPILAGCGKKVTLAEVEGKVTLNGIPLSGIQVQFIPNPQKGTKGPTATGVTDEEGNFELVSGPKQNGAAVGHHYVLLRDLQATVNKDRSFIRKEDGPEKAIIHPERIPPKYERGSKDALIKEVKAGKQMINLDLTFP